MSIAYDLSPARSRAETLERLDAIARLLDSAVRVPGTQVRVGADALLNVIPGIGTVVAKGISAYLVWEARRHGAPALMVCRMAGRVGIDLAISAVPVVGWFGDAFYRANLKNIDELRRHLRSVDGAPPSPFAGRG
ncbi:MAG: DUF4112 domain-containing protein [Bosea sp. (in: a-proteobacteria)]|uniref:DUF4112 domain-containing protein n=1 Tax=Bosea sp. (in: a-proteobacteria) TaxID=1871050 RepID=UPI002733A281|nr:DUF4112 domain-containing protein [Bosea sp. (in: a-proteobacteria)]MDP3257374.1 DUF4112 domain-containing protein [Bosea sp. (in: a-proteobacteria)]MDP3320373.1 DUF4112 domain-containing protein [Bosea sp. (in: a-proteobacteria)]